MHESPKFSCLSNAIYRAIIRLGHNSCHSRILHLQCEPPTFSLFHANVITCCHHFIWSCHCHLVLHALVSAVYSTSTSQILACLTCKISSLVVVEWADGSFLPIGDSLTKLFGPVSCLHNHCLNLAFACEISLEVHNKTCVLLNIFHITWSEPFCFASVSFLHLKPASETTVALTWSLALRGLLLKKLVLGRPLHSSTSLKVLNLKEREENLGCVELSKVTAIIDNAISACSSSSLPALAHLLTSPFCFMLACW